MLDSSFQRAQQFHRFLLRLLCCCGYGKKCCCSESSDFYADKIERSCCGLRDIFVPTARPEEEDENKPLYSHTNYFMNNLSSKEDLQLDIVWFAPGSTISVLLNEQEASFSHQHVFMENIYSRNFPDGQEKSEEYSCFNCLRVKRQIPKIRKRMVYHSFIDILFLRLREAEQIHSVSVLCFTVLSKITPEALEDLTKHLSEAKLNVELLAIDGGQCENTRIFWESIEFKHFFIASKIPFLLTEKMVSCGFLYLNTPLINADALDTFSGFGLVVREKVFQISRLLQEVEKKKINLSSNLQLFSIIFESEESLEEAVQTVLRFSGAECFLHWDWPYGYHFTYIPLCENEPDGAAIFICKSMVSFAVGDWKKWANTLSFIPCIYFVSRDTCF